MSPNVTGDTVLSPYLFIHDLEFLSAAIKYDPEITGVKISQYADDSSLILDDNPKSLDQSLFVLYTFSECAGLKLNLDKTEAIWLGSRRGCHEHLLPDKQLL
jgi:hypothetical protein